MLGDASDELRIAVHSVHNALCLEMRLDSASQAVAFANCYQNLPAPKLAVHLAKYCSDNSFYFTNVEQRAALVGLVAAARTTGRNLYDKNIDFVPPGQPTSPQELNFYPPLDA